MIFVLPTAIMEISGMRKTKLDKKLAKKKAFILKDSKNCKLTFSETSSKHLLVANGGLGNGVNRQDISTIFSLHGDVEDILMEPQKPYCFVSYHTEEMAVRARDILQAYKLRDGEGAFGVMLYLYFVNEVPKSGYVISELPEGLFMLEGFISEEEEQALLGSIDWMDALTDSDSEQTLKHRRVKHFGYKFNYDTNNIDTSDTSTQPIPDQYQDIITRIMATGKVKHRPDQITINQYLPGQGIPPHVDTHSAFEDAIISLSLGSQVVMDFTHPHGPRHVPVVVHPRTLLIMTGEARYLWSHGITPRKNDVVPEDTVKPNGVSSLTLVARGTRTSLTFRAIRDKPCHCRFPSQCDSQKDSLPPQISKPTSDMSAAALEKKQVHAVYNSIAPHFSYTRYKPWPHVTAYLNSLRKGSLVLDVGCGNGKYIGINKDIFMVGCDRSDQLMSICSERGHEVMTCDGLSLPIRSSSLDACLSIAVIHHFSTEDRRILAIQELVRILRIGGTALIYVWAMEQKRHQQKSIYLMKQKQEFKEGVSLEKEDVLKAIVSKTSSGESVQYPECQCSKLHEALDKDSALNTHSSQKGPDNKNEFGMAGREEDKVSHGSEENDKCKQKTAENLTAESFDELKKFDSKEDLGINETLQADSFKSKRTYPSSHLTVHKNKTEFVDQDLLVPWHLREKSDGNSLGDEKKVFYRFYHVFRQGELDNACKHLGNVELAESYYDQGNWCVVLKKTSEK